MDRNLTMIASVTLMLSIGTALPAADPESRKVGNVTPGRTEEARIIASYCGIRLQRSQ